MARCIPNDTSRNAQCAEHEPKGTAHIPEEANKGETDLTVAGQTGLRSSETANVGIPGQSLPQIAGSQIGGKNEYRN